jgi:hypothetical protein
VKSKKVKFIDIERMVEGLGKGLEILIKGYKISV